MAEWERLRGPFGAAVTVDVEEWYHNCWMPEYLDPAGRPGLVEELDRLVPEVLQLLDRAGARATFFVLGEVVSRLPARLKEIVAAGHEIASHGFLHFRVGDLTAAAFVEDLKRSKQSLEETTGVAVYGYRSPEWSLRSIDNPRLADVAAAGYVYDSSLAPCVGVGVRQNPETVYRFRPAGGDWLLEVPPLQLVRSLRLPASGWVGRLVAPSGMRAAARRQVRAGGLPVVNVHPWELVDRPLPGRIDGFGYWAHQIGRRGFREKFERLLATPEIRWTTIRDALRPSADERIPSELCAEF